MKASWLRIWFVGLLLASLPVAGRAVEADNARAVFAAALDNIAAINRPGQVGYASVWDGNKYVQCRRTESSTTLCEAAGLLMQPSLARVFDQDLLTALGWVLDERFGNFVHEFPTEVTSDAVAAAVVAALVDAYEANPSWLEFRTDWLPQVDCPARNGPTQNLAGMINDGPAAVLACSYGELSDALQLADHVASVDSYKAIVTAEIQRLRINAAEPVFVIFDAGIGYVQCMPDDAPNAIYCEAQSPESWPALAVVLTPERVRMLHQAGYNDPGRSPNYWKNYPMASETDSSIADEILAVLRDAYGFTGAWDLQVQAQ